MAFGLRQLFNQMNTFKEVQCVRKIWWYWIIFIPLTAFCAWSLLNIIDEKIENQVKFTLIILCAIPTALSVFLFIGRLKTEFNETEIIVKFLLFPVVITRTISWSQITKVYIRAYDVGEFKATGSSAIPFGNRGIAYHLFGEYGLQLESTEGNKILIGTRKPKSLQKFLKRVNKLS